MANWREPLSEAAVRLGNFLMKPSVAVPMRTRWAQGSLAAAVAGSLLCFCPGVQAQDAGAKTAMMTPNADPDWEVATVRPSAPDAIGDGIDQNGRHVTLKYETVEMLLVIGYNVQKSQIVNAPDWVKTAHWDIDGLSDTDGEMDLQQLQKMICKLLAERFGLKLHREQREMPVYALVVAKGGPKLAANTSDPNGRLEQHPRDGNGQHSELLKNFSMAELALILEFRVDRPIVDQTRLTGRYDMTLKWTYDEDQAPTDGSAAPSLFTAVQEQLGLKLEPVRAAAQVLVVDAVQQPGAN